MKHLLIDFENLQPANLDNIPHDNTHIWLFIGAVQKSLPIELVQSLLRFGGRAHLVRIKKTGKNALDFYLSYYLGQITATDPEALIGIVSRDGGYDVLLEHIADERQAKNIVRLSDLDEIERNSLPEAAATPVLAAETPPAAALRPLAPYYQAALSALRRPDAFRPSRLHNLQANLQHHVLKELLQDDDDETRQHTVGHIVRKLLAQKFISLDESGETVSYHLSDQDILLKIQRFVLQHRPKTAADFQAAVRERAQALCLSVTEQDIEQFAQWLQQQNLLRQHSGQIHYPPFAETPSIPAQPAIAQTVQPEAAEWKKLLLMLHAKNRPASAKSLHNCIKATFKCSDRQTEEWIQQLQNHRHIRLEGKKIIYL